MNKNRWINLAAFALAGGFAVYLGCTGGQLWIVALDATAAIANAVMFFVNK